VRQVKAPGHPGTEVRVFLAGSIEEGRAEQWQQRVVEVLADLDNLVIFNPRRDDWDGSEAGWGANAHYHEQVNWELDMLTAADLVIMYLAPGTRSAISLLELGLYANSGKLRVCCGAGFWRRGNVEVVCQRYGVPLFSDLDELLASVRAMLRPS
jgi:Nucleoside 2-deoxyribosyltransferase like